MKFIPIDFSFKTRFSYFNSFTLSPVDKVTTGTQSFVPVIENSVFPTAEEITHFLDQVKSRIISQLINGISRVLQKLLKY